MAAVVLGAGTGTRLRPLTLLRPKVLCPVAGRALVDHAIARAARATSDVAVNVHAFRDQMLEHLAGRVTTSVEDEPLGTAGAVGRLRSWVAGRALVVLNGDTWCPAPVEELLDGWDGERVRVQVAGPDPFGPRSRIVGSVLPWSEVRRLEPVPSGLYEAVWRERHAAGRLETVHWDGAFVDCGTPADYLRANLTALAATGRDQLVPAGTHIGGRLGPCVVVGAGAVVDGSVERAVVWPGSLVRAGESLVDAVRAGPFTVLVR